MNRIGSAVVLTPKDGGAFPAMTSAIDLLAEDFLDGLDDLPLARGAKPLKRHVPDADIVALAGLESAVRDGSSPGRSQVAPTPFLSSMEAVPFDGDAATGHGMIRADLQRRGRLVGANDLPVAAHAPSLGMVLVTHNAREFERVERLELCLA